MELYPQSEVLFVGAEGKMEMEKVPQAGYKIEGLWISGFQRRLTASNLAFPLKLISSLVKANKILRRFKPDVIVGVGGFASGPLLYAGTKRNIPALIQEQNSYPGVTNKILGSKVQLICVAYDKMDRFFPKEKIRMTGNPVRKDILDVSDKKERALEFFKFDPKNKVLLVLGGSLGARTINNSIFNQIQMLIDDKIQVIWQTGRIYFEEFQQKMNEYDTSKIRLVPFLMEMELAYAAADVVVSRAGALSVSELCLVKKPVIFVPSPNVAEDHQTKNAMSLTEKDAAVMIKDAEAFTTLVPEALKLLGDEPKQEKLKTNIAKLARPEATTHIVKEIIGLIN
jgi:UDP-N-acetylglucosamine--N-acetylmuramyl-(pentapeptide) pyrophosphoryl-undecaprenol N-acetylglucosamine transferase